MQVFYVLAAVFGVAFVVGVSRERRRFRNAVFLGLALVCLALGVVGEAYRLDVGPLEVVMVVGFALAFLAVLVLAVFLLANGVTMLRREGRRPANLLSLLAGLACIALLVLPILAQYSDGGLLGPITTGLLLVAVYLAFLFCSFLAYAVVYRRVGPGPDVDFVVVIGSGLIRGTVPPLLASRLDRAISLREDGIRDGVAPLLVASGGQGRDEPLPEARAMADYLLAHGVPEDQVVCEERSTTTLENLTFSKTIMADRLPGHRCVVVTNDFHALRTALMARRAGLNGHVVGSPTARYYWPSATIREFVAILAEHPIVNVVVCLLLLVVGVLAGVGR